MSPLRPSTVLMSVMLAAAMLQVAGSHAFAQLNSANTNALIQQNQLQTLQNSLQREQFQQQQQQYRAQDRVIVQQPTPVVPQARPSCQTSIIGTTAVNNCR